jgi:putative tryptophan/tyrosine transport system substrate-binding protein
VRRREFIALVGGAVLVWPTNVRSQPAGKEHRVAVISPSATQIEQFRAWALPELAKFGFVEGQNLTLTTHVGLPEAMPRLAQDVVATKPDAVVAVSVVAIQATKGASATVPIVMSFSGEDPVALGWARSIARPAGNITGLYFLNPLLDARRLHVLAEAVPAVRRIGVLAGLPPRHDANLQALQKAADKLHLELIVQSADRPDDYAEAFARLRSQRAQALLILSAPDFFRDNAILANRALEFGLPTMASFAESAQAGSLLGYGLDLAYMHRRTGEYLSRILNGTAPGELPVEHIDKIAFSINMKTAKALGLVISASLLAQANEVIE